MMMKPKTNVDSIVKARQAIEAWGFEALYKSPKDEPRGWPPVIEIHSTGDSSQRRNKK